MKSLRRFSVPARVAARLLAAAVVCVGRADAQLITEIPIPTPSCYPVSIVTGSDGALWFTESGGRRVSRIATDHTITEYVLPGPDEAASGIAAGPDGALWFVDYGAGAIGRITTAGAISEFPVPGLYGTGAGSIVTGPDGALWFVEPDANSIGRLTTAGVHTAFPIPTPTSYPYGIGVGPDGNLWFTESAAAKIGRITPSGSFTEYSIPTASCMPIGIAAGPDGGVWFVERLGGKVGRIDPANGVIAEYVMPSASCIPLEIVTGPDGALWFTEDDGNRIGRVSTSGIFTEYTVPSRNVRPGGIALGPDHALWFTENQGNAIGRLDPSLDPVAPFQLAVDSTGNGVLEPGETADVVPTWKNTTSAPLSLTGSAYAPGPGTDLAVIDGYAQYGSIGPGATGNCLSTGNCYSVSVSNPPVRPSLHWDVLFSESVVSGEIHTHPLHIGGSFTDVPPSSLFYRFVETLLHNGITGGCGPQTFCMDQPMTRAQAAILFLRSKSGAHYLPPACVVAPFDDVPCSSPYSPWIAELVARQVVTGCGGGRYCPSSPITRAQIATFLLRTAEGPAYVPPPCSSGPFADVPCTSPFAPWIQELHARGIAAGCGNGNYCPNVPVTRGQAAVFLTTTFGLRLYGP